MSGPVLIVTGARCLVDTPAATAWARGVLGDALVEVTGVGHGGAIGPDTWAGELARNLGLRETVYGLDGWVTQDGRRLVRWTNDQRPHPIARNRALVEAARIASLRGTDLSVLGLLAPWSRTHGTERTCAMADAAGLIVRVMPCPAEHAPAVAS